MRLRPLVTTLMLSLATLLARSAGAQISPGPLSSAHRDLDANTACLQCHTQARKGGVEARCLECHGEIAALRAAGRGYHARDAKGECASCHPEHGGREFQLIQWAEGSAERFPHENAGYPLEGKHAGVACAKCHQPRFQRSAVAAKIRRKDRAKSWLGLERACASCHEDPHRGELGTACEKCHDVSAWKPARGFDHAKSDFPLTGKHADVACGKCHKPVSDASGAPAAPPAGAPAAAHPALRWKPLPHADCAACHRDPHAGKFPGACAKCHSTERWTRIDEKAFDHSKTRYPLRGKHAEVACAKCHDPKTAWGPKPAFATCGSCHRDAHNGLATLAGKPADCAACHRVEGWTPSLYSVAQHATTRYPLEAAHARVECRGCHGRGEAAALGSARVVMRPVAARCVDCHRDPHGGRFAAGGSRAKAKECRACHGLDAFHPSTMTLAVHAEAGFALEGAHRAVPCQACHAELTAPPAASSLAAATGRARPLRFDEHRGRCTDCHAKANPHGDQFAKRKDGGACDGCHGSDAWKPATRFDHDRDSGYRLVGGHARASCDGCHKRMADPDGVTRVRYRPLDARCEACHATKPGPLGARPTGAGTPIGSHATTSRLGPRDSRGPALQGTFAAVSALIGNPEALHARHPY